jgi:hypothetical protein
MFGSSRVSEQFFEQENTQQGESAGIKSLREAYERQARELAELKADARKRQVEDLLPPGVNKKVASLYQGEPDKFPEWFEANKDLFGAPSQEQPKQPEPQTQESDDSDEIPQDWKQSMQRVTEGESGTSDPTASAGDLAKLDAFMKQYGNNAYEGLNAFNSHFSQ